MKGKIGLEEHFAIDDTLNDSKGFFPDEIWVEVRDRILDLHGRRLRPVSYTHLTLPTIYSV